MHKHNKKIKTRTIHICLTDINCSGLHSFSSTFITVYRVHCSFVGTVQRFDYSVHGSLHTFQSLIGTVQLLQCCCVRYVSLMLSLVSISHRYGSTTVFTAFYVFIIPYFRCFSIFFSKKVGQPLHSKFPQSLDSTGFFIFVKIDSEVHRLFGRFFAVFGTFPCCFCPGGLDFTGLEVHRLFLQIF